MTLVAAYPKSPYSVSGATYGQEIVDERVLRGSYETVLEQAREKLGETSVEVRAVVEGGDPTRTLVEYSQEAAVVVVGSRGRGGFAGRLLGSTSAGLPAHSSAPVLIVPSSYTQAMAAGSVRPRSLEDPVSVGVDGSQHSLTAALEAARLATERGVPLRLVDALPLVASDLSWNPLAEQRQAAVDELNGLFGSGVGLTTRGGP